MATIPRKIQQRIAEDVALQFYVLDTTGVVLRSKNTTSNLDETGHQLPLKYERRLASALAFISHTKKDSDHVTATAAYESGSSLHVLVAANVSGSSCLDDVRRGFDEIASILQDAKTSESLVTEAKRLVRFETDEVSHSANRNVLLDMILSVIIKLCRPRIKARLRIPRLKKFGAEKPPWDKLLSEVTTQLRRDGAPLTDLLNMVCESLGHLGTEINQLRNVNELSFEDVETGLRRVIDICYELSKGNDLQRRVEDSLRARGVNESTSQPILNLLVKVGHYKTCALEFIKMARLFPIVRDIRTTIVRLSEADKDYLELNSDIDLGNISKRVLPAPISGVQKLWLEERGKETSSPGNKRSQDALLAFQRTARIHAEIQIMRYIDSHTGINRTPRVIRASKDTCHLCHTFISTDGRYDVGKSHGKVYPGWRLPAIGNRLVYLEFAERLERGMMPHLRGKKPGDKVSNFQAAACESTVSTAATSLASIATIILGLSVVQDEEHRSGSDSEASEATVRGPKMQSSDEQVSTSTARVLEPKAVAKDQDEDIAAQLQSGEARSPSSQHLCSTGQQANVTESRSIHPDSYYLRPSQELGLFFDYDGRVEKGKISTTRPRVRLLTASESEKAQAGSFVYDLDKELRPGQQIECPAGIHTFCLAFRGKVYSVELKPRS